MHIVGPGESRKKGDNGVEWNKKGGTGIGILLWNKWSIGVGELTMPVNFPV